jgi:hypothetical protein
MHSSQSCSSSRAACCRVPSTGYTHICCMSIAQQVGLPPHRQCSYPFARLTMLSLLKASIEYVAVARAAGAEEGGLFDATISSLTKKFGEVRSVAMVEATEMLDLIGNSVLPKEKQRVLAEIINAKVLLVGESSTVKKMQVHNHVESYLTAQEWDQLTKPELTSDTDILHMLATRMLRIGLIHPSEPTSKNVVSLLTAARTCGGTGVNGLELIREYKKIHKSLGQGFHACVQGPTTYPANPETFKALHPAIYADAYRGEAAPVPCRIPKVDILRVQFAQPCRSTKASCKGVPAQKAAASDSTLQMQHMVAGAMHAFANLQEKPQQRAILDRGMSFSHQAATQQVPEPATQAASSAVGVSDPSRSGSGPLTDLPPLSPRKAKSPFPSIPLSWTPPGNEAEGPKVQLPTAPLPQKVPEKTHLELMEEMRLLMKKSESPGPAAAAKAGILKRPAASGEGCASSSAGEGFASPAAKRPALPKGWRVEERKRNSGPNKGAPYTLFYNAAGKQFRSWREVEDALM